VSALRSPEVRAYQARYGALGEREIRTAAWGAAPDVRDSGSASGAWTVKGLASRTEYEYEVGGLFRETIARGAFDSVVRDQGFPVMFNLEHDNSRLLASQASGNLELKSTRRGLEFWARPAPVSYADDARVLMERGDLAGSSFAFVAGEDEWTWDEAADMPRRRILTVSALYDVCACALGASDAAFVQSDAVRSYVRDYATGRASAVQLAKSRARAKRARAKTDADRAPCARVARARADR
jgi:uncharacterized protein